MRTMEQMRVLCKNTPIHLRHRHVNPDPEEELPDTFHPGMEETYAVQRFNPKRGSSKTSDIEDLGRRRTTSPAEPFTTVENSLTDETGLWGSNDSASDSEEFTIPETPDAAMPPPPPPPLSAPLDHRLSSFATIQDGFAGCHQDLAKKEWSQSRLDHFFRPEAVARCSQTIKATGEDEARAAITGHILSQHQRRCELAEQHEVLPSSQSQAPLQDGVASEDPETEFEDIPETLA